MTSSCDVACCVVFQGLPPLRQSGQSSPQVHPARPPTDTRPLGRPATWSVLTRGHCATAGASKPAPRPVHAPPAGAHPPRLTLSGGVAPRRLHSADGGSDVREFAEWRDLYDIPPESDEAAAVSVSVPDLHA